MLTLVRSCNNVSLIYLEYFFSYFLVPNFVNQLFVSRYDTTIKKAFPWIFGAIHDVSIRGFCAVQLAVDNRRYRYMYRKGSLKLPYNKVGTKECE